MPYPLPDMGIKRAPPMRCTCCGRQENTRDMSDVLGFVCVCHTHAYGTWCRGCHKCPDHCTCPEGPTQDAEEAMRRWLRNAASQ